MAIGVYTFRLFLWPEFHVSGICMDALRPVRSNILISPYRVKV